MRWQDLAVLGANLQLRGHCRGPTDGLWFPNPDLYNLVGHKSYPPIIFGGVSVEALACGMDEQPMPCLSCRSGVSRAAHGVRAGWL